MNIPSPPPMRAFHNSKWVNEYELVDWYTQRGELYHRELSLWERVFESKLVQSLKKNGECVE